MSLRAIAEFTDVRIPCDAGTLSADIIRPQSPAGVPTLLTVLPYRKDLDLYWHDLMRWFAGRGYACVMVDLRGTGRSDGVAPAKMSPEEARDSSAAMDWIIDQPWSDGQVGMWGMSSGGFTTLRAAEVGHPALRAVIPMLSPLQPDADAFHHDGARVDLHQRILWSAQLLVQQWLPPTRPSLDRDVERWRERQEHDPFFLDFVRHEAGDPEFTRRAVDVSRIRVPTLCIGGWRDLYARSMVELFEQLEVPKRLIMGPWFHRGPRVGERFFEIALEWWDHWLRGGPEPSGSPVRCATLDGQWKGFASWPPRVATMRLAAADDQTLVDGEAASDAPITHLIHSNATVGALSGSWGMPSAGEVLPADQAADDRRCVSLTSGPIGRDAVLAGAAEVGFELSPTEPIPTRIVVRLCLVHEDGRSEFITTGTLRPTHSGRQVVRLRPTLCALPAAARLRVALGDSDFPRLVPLPELTSTTLSNLSVAVPVLDPDSLERCDLFPSTGEPESGITAAETTPGWSIVRSPEDDEDGDDVVAVRFASRWIYPLVDGTRVGSASDVRATVTATRPDEAEFVADLEGSLEYPSGETAVVKITIGTRQTRFDAHAVLTVDGEVARSQTWSEPLRPEGIRA